MNCLFKITASNSKTLCWKITHHMPLSLKMKRFEYLDSVGTSRSSTNSLCFSLLYSTIKENRIYITKYAYHGIPIQYDSHTGCDYYVGNDNINCKSNVITLQWTASTSVELKALTLAFAIQCALTRHPITESVPVSLDNIYDSKKDVTSSADVQFQAQPIEHRPYKQSIFDTVDEDVAVFIRATGWYMKGNGRLYLVFNSSPPYDILFMAHQFKATQKNC